MSGQVKHALYEEISAVFPPSDDYLAVWKWCERWIGASPRGWADVNPEDTARRVLSAYFDARRAARA